MQIEVTENNAYIVKILQKHSLCVTPWDPGVLNLMAWTHNDMGQNNNDTFMAHQRKINKTNLYFYIEENIQIWLNNCLNCNIQQNNIKLSKQTDNESNQITISHI